jgi:hypothetical protein
LFGCVILCADLYGKQGAGDIRQTAIGDELLVLEANGKIPLTD